MKDPTPTALEFKQALKIITVAQFLKCPTHGSYEEDDCTFLAEFLDHPLTSGITPVITPPVSLDTPELPLSSGLIDAEKSSLHDVTGYCVNVVLKRKKLCLELETF